MEGARLGPVLRRAAPRHASGQYLASANDDVFVAILVELPEAVDNIEAIAAVPGVDLIFAAAYDLSVNLGHPGDTGHPEVTSAFRRVEAAALAAGVPIGGSDPTRTRSWGWCNEGYRSVAVGFDWSVYQRAVAAALAPVVDRRAAQTDPPRSGAAQT